MSALVGLLHLDGTPVEAGQIEAMITKAAYRGPDGRAQALMEHCGFGALLLRTSEQPQTPALATSEDGRFTICLDGVLDNRADLRHALSLRAGAEMDDAALILAAFQRWGEETPRHLLGDFAFAIWDRDARTLLLARDPVGMRLLYYICEGQRLAFGTTIPAVLAGMGGTPTLNHAVMAEYLDHRYARAVHETVYAGVMRLPQGCTLTVEIGKSPRLHRYWHFGTEAAPRDDAGHIERVREALKAAVRDRLQGVSPIGLLLSGGFDSSSVAVLAQHLFESEPGHPWPELRSYSLVHSRTSSMDERAYLDAVLDRCQGIVATRIPGDDIWGMQTTEADDAFPLDEPDPWPLRAQSLAVMRPALGDGCRRLLSGYGGDQVCGFGYQSGAIFREMGPRHWRQEWPYFRQYMGGSERLLRSFGAAFLPAPLVAPARPLLHRLRPRRPTMLRAEWLEAVQDEAPPPFQLTPPAGLPASALNVLEGVQGGWFSACLAYNDRLAGFLGAEFRDPFLDRRVIEAMTALPWHLRYGRGLRKLILRRALSDLLPPALLTRTGAAVSTELIHHGLTGAEHDKVSRLIETTISVQRRWLDADRYRQAWEAYRRGQWQNHWPLMTPIYLTIWADTNGISLS